MIINFALVVLALASDIAANTASVCFPSHSICVEKYKIPDIKGKCYKISRNGTTGWIALGFGTGMSGADIYAAYQNSSQMIKTHRLVGKGYLRPLPHELQNSIDITDSSKATSVQFQVAFCIPLDNDDFIFAFSDSPPTRNIDFDDADIEFHGPNFGRGSFSGVKKQETFEKAALIHGTLMWLSWVLLPVFGISIARHYKNSEWWFPAHVAVFTTVLGCTIASFMLIYSQMHPPHFSRPETPVIDAHIKTGLAVVILMGIQLVLGLLSHILYNPMRIRTPWLDKSHWYLGRGLTLLAFLNVLGGGYVFKVKFKPDWFYWVEIWHWGFVFASIMFWFTRTVVVQEEIKIKQTEKEIDSSPLLIEKRLKVDRYEHKNKTMIEIKLGQGKLHSK